jgi:hypothetical protein
LGADSRQASHAGAKWWSAVEKGVNTGMRNEIPESRSRETAKKIE